MVKSDLKQNAILLVFSFIMVEVLTTTTLAFVVLALITVAFNIKLNKYIRNALALGLFASYWITYGKIIDPEVGLNFLTSIIVIKILEKETIRDRYMIFFGLILLISAGSLFERTLTYVIFFAISFLVLIRDFYSYLGQKFSLKDFGLAIVWVFPLTFMLFFLVPRMLNPIPFQQNTLTPGEIGYTPDVNVSEIESLEGNQSPVFQAISTRPIKQHELYWRGNTLSQNDGWNWKETIQDKEGGRQVLGSSLRNREIKQSYRLFTKADYFFTLDRPRIISYGKETLEVGKKTKTVSQHRWNWIQKYEAISLPDAEINDEDPSKIYLRVPFSKATKEDISKKFSGSTPSEVINSIQLHFLKGGFSYSLAPGKSRDFQEFMQRKIGLCSHYASATALILRTKGIPSRLVSGFMGGNYNRFADFYLISQNDAHVWVEAFVDKKWIRLDPTEWIAPDRVILGGEAFVDRAKNGALSFSSLANFAGIFHDMKLWFEQWDFLFYQWLEQMDYNSQEAWLMRLKFKRQWLFSLIPIMMVLFMLGYYAFLTYFKPKEDESPYQELWRLYYKKMEKRGIILSKHNLAESHALIKEKNLPGSLDVWDELVAVSFAGKSFEEKEMRKRIKSL